MIVILINQNTIRHNPNAGETTFLQPGRPQHYVEVGPDNSIRACVSIPYQELHTFPQPKWRYEYQATKVKCEDCGAEFPWTELKSDEVDDCYSETICPKCGTWSCCDIRFERIDEAFERGPKYDSRVQNL